MLGGGGSTEGDRDLTRQPIAAHYEERRAVRTSRICGGTLACERCDAPVSPGDGAISLRQVLTCPYCGHRAPARDFLSLAVPTRPARVAVRINRW